MSELLKVKTQIISKKEAEELFQLVNVGRDIYVDPKRPEFIDKIIELWFEERGYDFWDNPFPDVKEWSVNRETGEITFNYIEN